MDKEKVDYTYDEIIKELEGVGFDVTALEPEALIPYSCEYRRPSFLVTELRKWKRNSAGAAARIALKKERREAALQRSRSIKAGRNWTAASVL